MVSGATSAAVGGHGASERRRTAPRSREAIPRVVRAIGPARGCTLISTPSGYRSSRVLSQWAESAFAQGLTVARIDVAECGGDVDRFRNLVDRALSGRHAVGRAEVAADARDGSREGAVRSSAGPGRGTVLLLDRLDRLGSGPARDFLRTVLADGAAAVVATVRGGDVFARMERAEAELRVIGAGELLLTRDEFARGCEGRAGVQPGSVVSALHRETGGVPVLVDAASYEVGRFAHGAAADGSAPASGSGSAPGVVPAREERFRDEAAWAAVGEAVGTAMTRLVDAAGDPARARAVGYVAAVHGSVTVRMIVGVLGVDSAAAEAAMMSLPLVPDAADRERWRLPPAARRAVLAWVREPQGRSPRIVGDVIRYLLDEADPSAALGVAYAAHDWEAAVGLIADRPLGLLDTDIELVRRVLVDLPEDIARADGQAAAARAMFLGLEAGSVDEAVAVGVVEDGQALIDVLSAGTVSTTVSRLAGRFAQAASETAVLSGMYGRASESSRAEADTAMPHLRMQWAINHQLAGDFSRAEAELRLAYAASATKGIEYVTKNAAGSLALLSAFRGEITRAERWLELEAAYPDPEGWLREKVRVAGLVARILTGVGRCDIGAARSADAELGELGEHEELWVFVALARARLAQVRGRAREGIDALDRVRALYERWAPPGGFADTALAAAAADLTAAAGDGLGAGAMLDRVPASRWAENCRLRIGFLSGAYSGGPAGGIAVDTSEPGAAAELLVLNAGAVHAAGHTDVAGDLLERAVRIADDAGDALALLALPQPDRDELLAAGAVPPRLVRLWRTHRGLALYPSKLSAVSLTVREREVLRCLTREMRKAEIAEHLVLSVNTVKTQLRSAYRKLGVHSQAEAIETARRSNLV